MTGSLGRFLIEFVSFLQSRLCLDDAPRVSRTYSSRLCLYLRLATASGCHLTPRPVVQADRSATRYLFGMPGCPVALLVQQGMT